MPSIEALILLARYLKTNPTPTDPRTNELLSKHLASPVSPHATEEEVREDGHVGLQRMAERMNEVDGGQNKKETGQDRDNQ